MILHKINKPNQVSPYILLYLAGLFAIRNNFIYVQILFGTLHGIGCGTGKLNQSSCSIRVLCRYFEAKQF